MQSGQSFSQLKMAQETIEKHQQDFDTHLREVVQQKDKESNAIMTALRDQLQELDAKFKLSQEVRVVVFTVRVCLSSLLWCPTNRHSPG